MGINLIHVEGDACAEENLHLDVKDLFYSNRKCVYRMNVVLKFIMEYLYFLKVFTYIP